VEVTSIHFTTGKITFLGKKKCFYFYFLEVTNLDLNIDSAPSLTGG
jgi:hypothetical protein